MKFQPLALVATALSQAVASPLVRQASKAPYFLQTGDSTVAVDGGWGDGFNAFLSGEGRGENHGKGGATTVSFRAQGLWDPVLEAVKAQAGSYEPIVTIQFGHNDQKEASGISVDAFQKNLETMVGEVQAAGGTAILITSLTRRAFKNGSVVQNLEEQRQRAIAAAEATGVQYLDLNEASTTYVNSIGGDNAGSYNYEDGDTTHLNPSGEKVFGRMVVDLLLAKRDDLVEYFEPAGELSRKIQAGEFATGDE